MNNAHARAHLGRSPQEAGFMDILKVLGYFFAAFSLIYFISSVSWVTKPGVDRFSVSCGLDNPVHYRQAGIYWKAGCSPEAPVFHFG